MKKIILPFLLLVLLTSPVYSQNITITDDENYTSDESAMLDVKSTTKGVLLPRLTDEQRDALYRNVPQGMLIFNTTDSALQIFIDTSWYTLNMVTPEIAPEPFNCGTSSISDYDGNEYSTVLIGSQCWMAENLRTTHYADGTPIPKVTGSTEWNNLGDTDSAYCWYDNDSATNAPIYGAFYTWAAVTGNTSSTGNPSGAQGICPDGWHVPSDEEWKDLEMFLGMAQADADDTGYRGTNEGSKLVDSASLWSNGNLENDAEFGSSGFTAFPGGYRDSDGTFYGLSFSAYFWCTTGYDTSYAWYRLLFYITSGVGRDNGNKTKGLSVCCTKD